MNTINKSNIILIGMPGAGKSTIGVVLAKSAGLQFVDTDLLIQQRVGTRLQSIIDSEGIEKFLELEEDVVSSLRCSGYVIATGGSIIYSEKAMSHLAKSGIIIYLDVPLEDIKTRLDNIKTRGIAMKPGSSIDSVYAERSSMYQKYSDYTVAAGNSQFEAAVGKIIDYAKQKGAL